MRWCYWSHGLAGLNPSQKLLTKRIVSRPSLSYTAKISDFGFAKWGPAPGNSFVTGHVVGTMGYTAPEYLAAGKLYVNSDVYSFGVVLLEMLTGLKAIDTKRPYGQDNLVQWWVKPYTSQKAKLRRMMDYRLEGKYSPKEALEIALLADRCLNWEPKLRPSTKEVAETLEKIETRYRTDNEQ
ncbi:probable serine/threonine-protein kinase PIX13 [Ricinus communis]|uniref:probable serine/threonine-protein kinase PIX13 n=1 Tax=Ricinus communis TaxID=3988 RepID=UPI00201B2A3C|nr:probable serine/threonine-protein kinase PIX13 [Ricinus communis]